MTMSMKAQIREWWWADWQKFIDATVLAYVAADYDNHDVYTDDTCDFNISFNANNDNYDITDDDVDGDV